MYWIQPRLPPLPTNLSLDGKTIVVTGANTGLGLGAARQLLQLGASTLVLAVRTPSKGIVARDALLADQIVQKVNPLANVLVYKLDLASHHSVISFVDKVISELPELHVLLLNGGVSFTRWTVSPSTGNETMFQVNVLSNALLSILLLPLLKATAKLSGEPSRITIVGSQGQEYSFLHAKPCPPATPLFEHLNDPSKLAYTNQRYADTKLLVAMWVKVLAAQLDASKVTVNVLCPGLVRTGILSQTGFCLRMILFFVILLLGRCLDEGSRTLTYAAVIAGKETHGKMLVNNKIAPFMPFMFTEEGKATEKKLWDETLALTTQL